MEAQLVLPKQKGGDSSLGVCRALEVVAEVKTAVGIGALGADRTIANDGHHAVRLVIVFELPVDGGKKRGLLVGVWLGIKNQKHCS